MIIDCHGHYTTAPEPHNQWREAQKAAFKAGEAPPPYPEISDDEIRETIEKNQLRLVKERGADLTIFSPRASAMAHHVGDETVSIEWARRCNDLIARVVGLYPDNFVGVCMLPLGLMLLAVDIPLLRPAVSAAMIRVRRRLARWRRR